MNVIGIIMEASPFHNGHAYFINQIKKKYPESLIICVTSTSFTMRGEISLINKFEKVKCLLKAGCDFVFELPISLALQSSDYFANNSVKILNALKVNKIICGATCNFSDLKKLNDIIHQEDFIETLNSINVKEKSLKKAYTQCFNLLNIDQKLIDIFNESNNTLAFQYYQAIINHHYPIDLEIIERIYSDNLPSGRKLNELVNKKITINNYLPFEEKIVSKIDAEEKLKTILLSKLYVNQSENYLDKEGILNYLRNHLNIKISYHEMIKEASNAKYTSSFLRRFLIKYALDVNQASKSDMIYLRMLGFDEKNIDYLNQLPKDIKELIFSKDEIKNNLTVEELKALKLYQIITSDENLINENKKLPIKIRRCKNEN